MPDLKEVLVRIREKKKERKEVHNVYRDLLAQSKPYQEVVDQLNQLKAKKLQLEHTLQSQCSKEIETAERLALDIKNDNQVLSDMALTKFMKGETIELTDENDVKYEPVFKVTFKKIA
jgi:predicted nuclease with TOPRIM domain